MLIAFSDVISFVSIWKGVNKKKKVENEDHRPEGELSSTLKRSCVIYKIEKMK